MRQYQCACLILLYPGLKNYIRDCFAHSKIDELFDFLMAIELDGKS